MSSLHLSTGAQKPAKVDGKLRLYSMEYCPFAHRVRLVLLAKNIPHDIVNVNLINKPEWLFDLHPEGKVPALDTGSRVICESLDIANYLEEVYPDHPLYPADPSARDKDKALIEKLGPMQGIFSKLILGTEKKSVDEWLNEFTPHLDVLEAELEKRKSRFFGGEQPGMVDYMLWPLAERAGVILIVLGERLPLAPHQYPKLRAWRNDMRIQQPVDAIYHGPEKFFKTVLIKKGTVPPDYDNV